VIALLDVGVLVALFDPTHLHHDVAHSWLEENRGAGWATCPMTENGFLRAVAHPDYPGRRCTLPAALERLQGFTSSGDHHFWHDSTSLRRASRVEADRLEGTGCITAAYLLLLAVHHGGRLATFDPRIPRDAVRSAGPERIVVLDGGLAAV
jgi:toxin-antitoxin system PIN domain toxin